MLGGALAFACGEITAQHWQETAEAASRHSVEPELLAALVWQESRYCADAVSPAGAIGLGQLMPATAQSLGVDPWEPVENLEGAARYLRTQLDTFGTLELALAAYNAGPGAVERYSGIPPFDETQAYVPAVLAFYENFKQQGAAASTYEPAASEPVPLEPVSLEPVVEPPPALIIYQQGDEQTPSGNGLFLYSSGEQEGAEDPQNTEGNPETDRAQEAAAQETESTGSFMFYPRPEPEQEANTE